VAKKTVAGRYDMPLQSCHHLPPLPQLFHLPRVIQVEPSQFLSIFELRMKQSVHLNKKLFPSQRKKKETMHGSMHPNYQNSALVLVDVHWIWKGRRLIFLFFWLKCLIRKKQSLIWIQDAG
jgi:hypothetical protein